MGVVGPDLLEDGFQLLDEDLVGEVSDLLVTAEERHLDAFVAALFGELVVEMECSEETVGIGILRVRDAEG